MGSMLNSLVEAYYEGINGKKYTGLLISEIKFTETFDVKSEHVPGTDKNIVQNNGSKNKDFRLEFYFFSDVPDKNQVSEVLKSISANLGNDKFLDEISDDDLIKKNAYDKSKEFVHILSKSRYGKFRTNIYTEIKDMPVTVVNYSQPMYFNRSLDIVTISVSFKRYTQIATSKTPKSNTKEGINEGVDKITILTNKEIENVDYVDGVNDDLSVKDEFASIPGNTTKQAGIVEGDLKSFSDVMSYIVKSSNDIQNSIYEFEKKIDNVLDTYITDPLFAILEIQDLLKTPARIITNISNKINGYASFIDILLKNDVKTYSEKAMNNFMLTTTGAAVVLATTVGEYVNRNEVAYVTNKLIEVREKINGGLSTLEGDVEANLTETYNKGVLYTVKSNTRNSFDNLITETCNYLDNNIYKLPLQSNIILDRERNFIELCNELYGNVDEETLNKFINDNDIKGYELFTLQPKRIIIFYEAS